MPTPPQPVRNREHPRVSADFMVRLQVGPRQIAARARNLSMTGLFIDDPLSPLSGEVHLRIPLPGLAREVVTECRVERRELHGVALSFARIDWDDLLLMARYLAPRI